MFIMTISVVIRCNVNVLKKLNYNHYTDKKNGWKYQRRKVFSLIKSYTNVMSLKSLNGAQLTLGLCSMDLSDTPSLTSFLLSKSPRSRSVTSFSLNRLSGTYLSLWLLESLRCRNTSSRLRPNDDAYDDEDVNLLFDPPKSDSTGLR